MDEATSDAAVRRAERLAVRELGDAVRMQNYLLAWVGSLLTVCVLFGAWLYVKLDGMNVLTRLIG